MVKRALVSFAFSFLLGSTWAKPLDGVVVSDDAALLTQPAASSAPVMARHLHMRQPGEVTTQPPTSEPVTLQIGSRVRVLKETEDRKWRLVESSVYCDRQSLCQGWTLSDAIASRSEFRVVTKWDGPSKIDVGAGDYADTFNFSGNGRFVTETERGRLYRAGPAVLAIGIKGSSDVFFFRGNQFCWADDVRICVSAR
jgi:hypothetical protein